ncbi:MAG: hypothetical protein C0411_00990 [Pseudomonas sp.]|nr:hypothetical protein [Pseudomonas sp.]
MSDIKEEKDSKTIEIKVRCLNCAHWFDSGIWLPTRLSFATSTLFGNKQQCPKCGELTDCNKENFHVRFEDGGFMGVETI